MKFAEIIRSSRTLQTTFEDISSFDMWWRIVLVLHGKPVAKSTSEEEKLQILVKGFQFYGYLYLGLGLCLLCVFSLFSYYEAFPSTYWAMLSAFFAVYLIASSQLAFKGATLFAHRHPRGAVMLVCFFVSIIVFLATFGALASATAYHNQYITDVPNVVLYVIFVLFGIGSYFIELIYLLWHSSDITQS